MLPPANFNNAVLASKSLVEIIEDETESYVECGMLGPRLFAAIATMSGDLDPEVVKDAEEHLVNNGLSPEAAQQAIRNLPNVAAELIRCVIQGQKP